MWCTYHIKCLCRTFEKKSHFNCHQTNSKKKSKNICELQQQHDERQETKTMKWNVSKRETKRAEVLVIIICGKCECVCGTRTVAMALSIASYLHFHLLIISEWIVACGIVYNCSWSVYGLVYLRYCVACRCKIALANVESVRVMRIYILRAQNDDVLL